MKEEEELQEFNFPDILNLSEVHNLTEIDQILKISREEKLPVVLIGGGMEAIGRRLGTLALSNAICHSQMHIVVTAPEMNFNEVVRHVEGSEVIRERELEMPLLREDLLKQVVINKSELEKDFRHQNRDFQVQRKWKNPVNKLGNRRKF